MNPGLTYQMAQDRRAELLREAEECRRAGPTILMRIRARISRFPYCATTPTRRRTSRTRNGLPRSPRPTT